MRICLFLLVFLGCLPLAKAQASRDVFVAVSVPQKFNYSKTALTADLAKAKNIDEARKIILDKKFGEGEIAIHINPGKTSSQYWTLYLGRRFRESLNNKIVLRSKYSSDPLLSFSKIDDFKTYLSDSTVYMDTLRVEILVFDAKYPDTDYIMEISCESGGSFVVGIPFRKGQLLIDRSLFASCGMEPVDYVIRNKSRSDRKLATGRLIFLSDDALALLADIYTYEKETMPTVTPEARMKRLDEFLRATYGSFAYYPQLKAWFSKKERGL